MNELNRRIAEALGLTVIEENGYDGGVLTEGEWILWKNWTNNTDAALELVSSPGLLLTLGYDADTRAWHAHLKLVDNTGALISSGGAFDNIVSVAICRAWLAWKEGQK